MIMHSSLAQEQPAAGPAFPEGVRTYCEAVLDRLPWPGGGDGRPIGSLGITSCSAGEGVSTLAVQLAATAALMNEGKVLLVDGNLARPALHHMLEVAACPGLADCLRQGERLPEAFQSSPVAGLSVLAAGKRRGSVARAYASPGLPSLVKELTSEFELVVFDLPAVGQASCISRLAGLLDGVLLVVESERVHWDVAQRVKELLLAAEARLLGAVLNKRCGPLPPWADRP